MIYRRGRRLQAPNKAIEGAQHPERDEQFEHVTEKKELVGNFENAGREWHPQG